MVVLLLLAGTVNYLRPIPDVPAYRRFEVRPMPGGGITSAEAQLDTPYGPIRSSWRIDGDRFSLDVDVAPGTDAEVTLPHGTTQHLGPGSHRLE